MLQAPPSLCRNTSQSTSRPFSTMFPHRRQASTRKNHARHRHQRITFRDARRQINPAQDHAEHCTHPAPEGKLHSFSRKKKHEKRRRDRRKHMEAPSFPRKAQHRPSARQVVTLPNVPSCAPARMTTRAGTVEKTRQSPYKAKQRRKLCSQPVGNAFGQARSSRLKSPVPTMLRARKPRSTAQFRQKRRKAPPQNDLP